MGLPLNNECELTLTWLIYVNISICLWFMAVILHDSENLFSLATPSILGGYYMPLITHMHTYILVHI